MTIKCPKCEREFSADDFLGREICYKCSYSMKNVKWPDPTFLEDLPKCKICDNLLPKQKRKYCSDYCAKKGLDIKRKQYWTDNVSSDKVSWKDQGFSFRRQES